MQVKKQQLEPDREQRAGSKFGKGGRQGCMLSACYLLLCRVHHVKCWVDESQAGIKIAERNIRYTDASALVTEREEELKSLLMKVKEERGKTGLKLNIQETKIVASSPITSWQIDGEK